ncbi:MAG: hypothetical protein RSG59_04210 [Ruthenibacterium sp.]
MALHIDLDIEEKYASFYKLALHETFPQSAQDDTLLIENRDDDTLFAMLSALQNAQTVRCVIVRDCPRLQSLSALAVLTGLRCVGIWRCPRLCELWDMSRQPLAAFVLVACKRMNTLAPLLGCANTLQHLFLQGRAWNAPSLATLAPLPLLHALVTCDLAVKKIESGQIIYFEECYPQLEALTITPNLAKYFKRVRE